MKHLLVACIASIACLCAFAVDTPSDPLGECQRVEKRQERPLPKPRLFEAGKKLKPKARPEPEYEYECPPLQFPRLQATYARPPPAVGEA